METEYDTKYADVPEPESELDSQTAKIDQAKQKQLKKKRFTRSSAEIF